MPRLKRGNSTNVSVQLAIEVDGNVHYIDLHRVNDAQYREALRIGIAEMIHKGLIRLADIQWN